MARTTDMRQFIPCEGCPHFAYGPDPIEPETTPGIIRTETGYECVHGRKGCLTLEFYAKKQ